MQVCSFGDNPIFLSPHKLHYGRSHILTIEINYFLFSPKNV